MKTAKNIRREKPAGVWPVTQKWIAMGTFVVYTAIGSKIVTVGLAQDLPGATQPSSGSGRSWSLTVRRFDIPAGSLSEVLDAFRNATHLLVVAKGNGLGDLASPGVSGLYSPEQALRRALEGTGLSYHFTAAGEVTIELRGPDTLVQVTEHVEVMPSPKYSAPVLDTPQTITQVPQEVMQAQGTTTLRDALRNVPGLSIAAGEGGSQGDNLTIRGFTARNDLFVDGMRDFGSYYRDPFNMQEVQVLQGPSSVTFGRGSTGGVVNQATKVPQLGHILAAEVRFRY